MLYLPFLLGSMNGLDVCPDTQKALHIFNSRLNANSKLKGYYASISLDHWMLINKNDTYKGCSGHYNDLGHQILADDIIPQIINIFNDNLIVLEEK
jgi:hypothetical protein